MIEREIRIHGMSCNHCVMAVRRELSRVPGVTVKEVAIGSAVVSYDETTVGPGLIRAAIEAAGFSVEP